MEWDDVWRCRSIGIERAHESVDWGAIARRPKTGREARRGDAAWRDRFGATATERGKILNNEKEKGCVGGHRSGVERAQPVRCRTEIHVAAGALDNRRAGAVAGAARGNIDRLG